MGSFVETPIRQAYLNEIVPSAQRATMLSFVNLMSSVGGVGVQPALGQLADVAGYARSYLAAAAIQLCSLPFLLRARRERSTADNFERERA